MRVCRSLLLPRLPYRDRLFQCLPVCMYVCMYGAPAPYLQPHPHRLLVERLWRLLYLVRRLRRLPDLRPSVDVIYLSIYRSTNLRPRLDLRRLPREDLSNDLIFLNLRLQV